MQSVVQTRYAKALVDVVTAPATRADSAQVLSQLQAIRDLIASSPELRAALASPAVAPSRKRNVMAKLLAPMNVLLQVRNFVFVVIDHRRVDSFAAMVEAFETLLDEKLGYVRADIVSAHELSQDRRISLESEVSRLAGRNAKLKFTVNTALIAGVVARVGSKVYDGSVRGQLDRLRTQLVRG